MDAALLVILMQILMQSGKASLSSSQQAGIQLVLLEQKCSNVEASQQLFRKKKKRIKRDVRFM